MGNFSFAPTWNGKIKTLKSYKYLKYRVLRLISIVNFWQLGKTLKLESQ